METKLTLKLDKTVINSVKIYAEKITGAFQKLVEDYFKKLIMEMSPRQRFRPWSKN